MRKDRIRAADPTNFGHMQGQAARVMACRALGRCDFGRLAGRINANRGAESVVSFLLSLLTGVHSYAMLEGIRVEKAASCLAARPLYPAIETAAAVPSTVEPQADRQSPLALR